MYFLRVLSFIRELRFNVSMSEHVWVGGDGLKGGGGGGGATSRGYTCLSRHFF